MYWNILRLVSSFKENLQYRPVWQRLSLNHLQCFAKHVSRTCPKPCHSKKMSRPGFFPPGFRPLAYGAPGHAVKGAFRADGREDKRMSPAATWPAAGNGKLKMIRWLNIMSGSPQAQTSKTFYPSLPLQTCFPWRDTRYPSYWCLKPNRNF